MSRPARLRPSLVGLVAVITLAATSPALAALPRTYQVQRVDSPAPTVSGKFALSLVNVGDVNGDAKADILTGTDKHGADVGQGQVTVISGSDGSVLRRYALPDVDPGGTGDRRPAGFGNSVTVLGDVGRCTSSPGAGLPCPSADVSATADGVAEHVVSASGVDVDPATGVANPALNNSLGVIYIFDGATGALLKRLEMPAGDRAQQVGFLPQAQDPRFGRSVLSPGDIVNAAGNLGADGKPDLLVSATDYTETPGTAAPGSACAASLVARCTTAGRIYLYSGAQFLTGGAFIALDSPARTIRSPLSQPDNPNPSSPFSNSGGFGSLLIPIGDAGTCPTPDATNVAGANPGAQCATRTGINTLAGRPDFATGASEYDAFGMEGVGRVIEIDGETLSTVQTTDYPEPAPGASWGQAQNGTVFPAIGDVFGTAAPDFYVPDIQWGGRFAAQGRGFVINGQPSQQGSTFFGQIPARLSDPTPQNSEQFGLSAAGFGDVGGVDTRPEIMVGAIGPHNPGTNPNIVNDVHIFDPTTGLALQSIQAPDAQPGEAFGVALAPLGDLNGDGFKDFAVGAGFYDSTAAACPVCPNAGRLYIFRSDNSPAPAVTPAPSTGGTTPVTPILPPAAVTRAGRTIELAASRKGVRTGTFVTLRGVIEAFSDRSGCEPRQTVSIQRRRPGSPRYVTIAQRRSGTRGTFSVRTRVRITGIYRARVAQTATCLGAVSGGELVSALRRVRTP